MSKTPYMILIRDGWGYNPDKRGNAIYHAKTPNHDRYITEYPTALIVASGENVGLPSANQGSSEVGHLNMGAGRVVYQSLVRINNSIDEGDFFKNETLLKAMETAKKRNSTIHVWGLVQDQGVHAHTEHCNALIELAKNQNIKKEQLQVHVFSDGRDTPPQSAKTYIKELEEAINKFGVGVIGSIVGRYYAMDRDNRWERVKIAYDLLTQGVHNGQFSTVYEAIDDAYTKDETDEFIKPRVTNDFQPVKDNDVIIFFNYRLDRTRELTKAFVQNDFNEFETVKYSNLDYVCFTEYYDGVLDSNRAHVSVAFPPRSLSNLFGEYLSNKGLTQLRIAETEKFAHVTFFWNGQSDVQFEGEDRILVPSPKVATYDMQPEMSAFEVRDKVLEAINSEKYDVIVLNYANPDMVGHTGDFKAAVTACEAVDTCVGDTINAVLGKNGVVLLTADHGNSEQMLDYTSNGPMTAHTNNLVWLSCISKRPELQKDKVRIVPQNGKLADIAPTLLTIMGLPVPEEMEGKNIIEKL